MISRDAVLRGVLYIPNALIYAEKKTKHPSLEFHETHKCAHSIMRTQHYAHTSYTEFQTNRTTVEKCGDKFGYCAKDSTVVTASS